MGDPTVFLTPPGEPDDSITNGFLNPTNFLSYASPSAWICKIIQEITGHDPVAEATQWLAGDWSAIWKFGDAMGNLAQFMQELGIEIEQGMLTLDHSWHGNAEDAAYMYFSDLAATVSGQQTAMFNAQDSYHLAAKGAWQFANQLANLLQSIADEAVIAAMTMAASTGAATTGIGAAVGILGYAGSALLVARILDKVNQASQIINYSGMAIMGMFGLVSDAAAQTGHLSNVPLPVSGFSLPAAAS